MLPDPLTVCSHPKRRKRFSNKHYIHVHLSVINVTVKTQQYKRQFFLHELNWNRVDKGCTLSVCGFLVFWSCKTVFISCLSKSKTLMLTVMYMFGMAWLYKVIIHVVCLVMLYTLQIFTNCPYQSIHHNHALLCVHGYKVCLLR